MGTGAMSWHFKKVTEFVMEIVENKLEITHTCTG